VTRRVIARVTFGLSISIAALALVAATASAASTRAEYVSQVDRVCTSFVPQFAKLAHPLKKVERNLKQNRADETGAHEKRRFNRLLRVLGRYTGSSAKVLAAMTEQVALVGPAPGDETAVAQWIEGLKQFAALQAQSAPALKNHKLGQAAALSQRSVAAVNSGGAAVADFGISACLTHIDVPEASYSDTARG
jgi:hypothetical protein